MNLIKTLLIICVLAVGGIVFGQSVTQNRKEENSNLHFEKVYKTLTEKPTWLFSEDFCPFDIFPKKIDESVYIADKCDKDATVCLENCKKNDGMACYTLAVMIQIKKTPNQDYSEALFLRACKLGVISGCTNRAARILNDKSDDEKAVECAVDTFEKTCENNDPWGCTMLGFAFYSGQGRPQDFEKALKILPKACNKYGEEDEACQTARQFIEEINKTKKKITE